MKNTIINIRMLLLISLMTVSVLSCNLTGKFPVTGGTPPDNIAKKPATYTLTITEELTNPSDNYKNYATDKKEIPIEFKYNRSEPAEDRGQGTEDWKSEWSAFKHYAAIYKQSDDKKDYKTEKPYTLYRIDGNKYTRYEKVEDDSSSTGNKASDDPPYKTDGYSYSTMNDDIVKIDSIPKNLIIGGDKDAKTGDYKPREISVPDTGETHTYIIVVYSVSSQISGLDYELNNDSTIQNMLDAFPKTDEEDRKDEDDKDTSYYLAKIKKTFTIKKPPILAIITTTMTMLAFL